MRIFYNQDETIIPLGTVIEVVEGGIGAKIANKRIGMVVSLEEVVMNHKKDDEGFSQNYGGQCFENCDLETQLFIKTFPNNFDEPYYYGLCKGYEVITLTDYVFIENKEYTLSDLKKAIDLARTIIEEGKEEEEFDVESITGCTEVCTYDWKNKYSEEDIIKILKENK